METKTTKIQDVMITGYGTDYVFHTIEQTGNFYEAELLNKWTPLLGNPKTILDIGANLGNHTVYWGMQLKPDLIISIEPYKPNYELLCKNIENNKLKNAKALNIALGEKDGFATVKEHNPENYGGTSFSYTDETAESDAVAKVKTADSIVEEYHISNVDFIKIDTEGFELSVIKGLLKTIDRDMPILWIEVGSETVVPLYELLGKKGYVLVDMVGANLLFLPEHKRHNQSGIKLERVIQENMTLLSKVNTYYSNYEKSKKWLQSKNEQLQETKGKLEAAVSEKADVEKFAEGQRRKLEEQVQLVTERCKKAEENYQSMKETVRIRNEQLEKAGEKQRQLELSKQNELKILSQAKNEAMKIAMDRIYQEHADVMERWKQAEEARIKRLQESYHEELEKSRRAYDALSAEYNRLNSELVKYRQSCDALHQKQLQTSTELDCSKREYLELCAAYEGLQVRTAQYEEHLMKTVQELEKEERFLASAKQQLLQINSQLQQAKQQNRIYEEKLNKVYNTWYGRIVLKCYKLLRKIKHMVMK